MKRQRSEALQCISLDVFAYIGEFLDVANQSLAHWLRVSKWFRALVLEHWMKYSQCISNCWNRAWIEKHAAYICWLDISFVTPFACNFPKVRSLTFNNEHILDPQCFPNLEELITTSTRDVHDQPSLLCAFPDLKRLSSFQFPDQLTNLTHLDLRSAKILSIDRLETATELVYLDLGNNPGLANVNNLQSLTKLRCLNLHWSNRVTSIAALTSCSELEFLCVDDLVTDIELFHAQKHGCKTTCIKWDSWKQTMIQNGILDKYCCFPI